MVHKDTRLSEEALDVDQAQNGDLFLHSATDDDILAVVIKLLKSRILNKRRLTYSSRYSILVEVVVLIVYS
jgi:hypothetical protein